MTISVKLFNSSRKSGLHAVCYYVRVKRDTNLTFNEFNVATEASSATGAPALVAATATNINHFIVLNNYTMEFRSTNNMKLSAGKYFIIAISNVAPTESLKCSNVRFESSVKAKKVFTVSPKKRKVKDELITKFTKMIRYATFKGNNTNAGNAVSPTEKLSLLLLITFLSLKVTRSVYDKLAI